jgi:hypothetical protein
MQLVVRWFHAHREVDPTDLRIALEDRSELVVGEWPLLARVKDEREVFMSLAPEPKQRSPPMRAGPFSVRTVSKWPTSATCGPRRSRVTGTTIESP